MMRSFAAGVGRGRGARERDRAELRLDRAAEGLARRRGRARDDRAAPHLLGIPTPEQIAPFVVYLASDESAAVTGTVFPSTPATWRSRRRSTSWARCRPATDRRFGMAAIEVDHVTKEFAGGVRRRRRCHLTVADGEFMVLVGPSGCGKSTLLRMIAGLEEVTDGTVSIGDVDVTELRAAPPRHRHGLPELCALSPHGRVARTSASDSASAGRRSGRSRGACDGGGGAARPQGLLERKPAKLSGGQRQRVAMGRAIIREPKAYPHGRAALEPRRQAPRRDARLARGAARPPCRHEHLRHPRPDGGDDAWPARRRHAGRPDRPGRRAAASLPGSGRPLRGVVHRLALDEPRRGGSSRETRSSSDSSVSASTRRAGHRLVSSA